MFPLERNFPYIVGFVGSPLGSGFGTGKTLGAVEAALYLANLYKIGIASTIRLNPQWIRHYCRLKGYKFLEKYLRYRYLESFQQIPDLNKFVIIFDEAGQALFSRGFSDKSRQFFLEKLFTLRHRQCFLFYTAQDGDQIDKQLRARTDNWMVCASVQKWDKQKLQPKLLVRSMFLLPPDKYARYRSDPRIFSSHFKTMWLARGQYKSEILSISRLKHFFWAWRECLRLFQRFNRKRSSGWHIPLTIEYYKFLRRRGLWLAPIEVLFNCFPSFNDSYRLRYDLLVGYGLVPRGVSAPHFGHSSTNGHSKQPVLDFSEFF